MLLSPKRIASVLAVSLAGAGLWLWSQQPTTARHYSYVWQSSPEHSQAAASCSATAARLHPSELVAWPLVEAVANFTVMDDAGSNETVNVSVCAVPTHEEQYLPEWLTFHRLQGVQRFHLFDNAPSAKMRALLRPWLQEGSVVLYEMDYDAEDPVGMIWQSQLIRLCERHVLPHSSWTSHFDVDEFLMVDAPHWTPAMPSPAAKTDLVTETRPVWDFPLHRLLRQLHEARCVPLTRLTFQNYGARQLEPNEMVVERHTVREKVNPSRSTYGKMFLHSDSQADVVNWLGPHRCKVEKPDIILTPTGERIDGQEWPAEGLPLTSDSLALHHYVQRSLRNCQEKFAVLVDTPRDWRTIDGLPGCARNYIPTVEKLSDHRDELLAESNGEELVQVPLDRLYLRDVRARDSFAGRGTRAILDEWTRRGKLGDWSWLTAGANDDLKGVVAVEIFV